MVQVWIGIDNPDGMFAERHRALPYLQAGLPASWADGATGNAAWGIALLQKDACGKEIRAIGGLAQLTRAQSARLVDACALAQGRVLGAFQRRESAARLNSVAHDAWAAFLTERDRALTPEQKARLAAVVEPGG
jgi:hypothetical protein